MSQVHSVLRALVLLGGTGTLAQIVSKMWVNPSEVQERLETWRSVGAVERIGERIGERWKLIPVLDEPHSRYPRATFTIGERQAARKKRRRR
jgi:DNA-binding IclR family transcriptional regulator